MRPLFTLFIALFMLTHPLAASEHDKSQKSRFYIALKALAILGDTIEEEEGVTLEGAMGHGVGFELGCRLGYGFAIEGDWAIANNDITEITINENNNEKESRVVRGNYATISLDLVYNYNGG